MSDDLKPEYRRMISALRAQAEQAGDAQRIELCDTALREPRTQRESGERALALLACGRIMSGEG